MLCACGDGSSAYQSEAINEFLNEAGTDGSQGPDGSGSPSAAFGMAGTPINWRGTWISETDYVAYDVVAFDGRAYIAIQNTSGTDDPTNTDYWHLFAEKGADGPVGPQGPAGVDGQAGTDGPQGIKGPAGLTGADGPQGVQGPSGPQGESGSVGTSLNWQGTWSGRTNYVSNDVVEYTGRSYIAIQNTSGTEDPSDTAYWELLADKGADGETGPQGPVGLSGPQGVTGPTGPQGPAGVDGEGGAQGIAGPVGLTGADGPQGMTGTTGPQGVAGLVGLTGADGPQGIQGPAGAAGAQGETGGAGTSFNWLGSWSSGTNFIANDVVAFNGRSYIAMQNTTGTENPSDTAFWELFADKGADGETGPQGPFGLTGPQGIAGPVGPQGPVGAEGEAGADGTQGIAGSVGLTGADGPQGIQGAVGSTGPEGPQGIQGADGLTGPEGPQGIQGLVGLTGAEGPQGTQGAAGPAGATGPQGETGITGTSFNWQGSWSDRSVYATFDVVAFNGRSYIAIQTPASLQDPTDTAYWELLADQGTDGALGPQGPIGLSGPQGEAGPAGPQGSAGVDGTDGADGSQGIQGLTGQQGPSGMDWRGNWQSGTNYLANDVVAYDSSSYIAILDTSRSELPTDQTYWELVAQKATTTNNQYQVTGFTSTTVTGTGGYLSLANACETEFGSSARVATSQEVLDTPALATGSGLAWVRGISASGGFVDGWIMEMASGMWAESINCQGWRDIGTTASLVLDTSNHSFANASCNTSHKVACAIPATTVYDYGYVGFSTSTVIPGGGYNAINGACQSDYGVNARIATSREVFDASGLVAQTGYGWVESIRDPSGGTNDQTTGNEPNTNSCNSWSSSSNSHSSLVIDGTDMHFGSYSCDGQIQVACSAPQ